VFPIRPLQAVGDGKPILAIAANGWFARIVFGGIPRFIIKPELAIGMLDQRRIRGTMVVPRTGRAGLEQRRRAAFPWSLQRSSQRDADALGVSLAVGVAHVEQSIAVADSPDVGIMAGGGVPVTWSARGEHGTTDGVRAFRCIRDCMGNLGRIDPASHPLFGRPAGKENMDFAISSLDRRIAPDVPAFQLKDPADRAQSFRKIRKLVRRDFLTALRPSERGRQGKHGKTTDKFPSGEHGVVDRIRSQRK